MDDKTWSNWSGSLVFKPGEIATPESESQVVELVKNAMLTNRKIRVVGAGHSSSPLVRTNEILLSLKHFRGVEKPDNKNNTATLLAGMTVKEAGEDLLRYGLAMHNTGDVDVQTVAGAIATGTHGSGTGLKNLSTMLIGVRMVTGAGEIIEISQEEDPELFRALQVSLGTCGIFLKMRLQLQPAYTLYRREWCVPLKTCLEHLEQLKENNRNFDFYWYPRSDLAKIRVMNEKEQTMPDFGYDRLQFDKKGHSHEILPRSRHLKFDEMEYAMPAENGIDCFLEIRAEMKKNWRREVAWRVLYRTIQQDDAYISTMSHRDSVTISLHHNAGLSYKAFFSAIEPIFRKHGGRPHWGKKHYLKAQELKKMYPQWHNFQKYREKLDPHNIFLTSYMEELLIS